MTAFSKRCKQKVHKANTNKTKKTANPKVLVTKKNTVGTKHYVVKAN